MTSPRLTRRDLEVIDEALRFVLAGEIDGETDAEAEQKRQDLEDAQVKVAARLARPRRKKKKKP